MRGNEPAVAKGILDPAGAIAVELIRHWSDELGSRRHGALDRRVDVFDIEVDRYRRTADRPWAKGLDLGVLVGQHDPRIADLDLGMADPAARGVHPHHLFGTQRSLIEGDRFVGAAENQIGRHAVIAVRDRFHCRHSGFLSTTVSGKHRAP